MKQLIWICLGCLVLCSYPAIADDIQDNALITAAKKGDVEEVKRQLKAGAIVDAIGSLTTNNDGLQAIHFAARYGNINEVKILLAAGAKVDAIDFHGMQPLHYAALNGSVELVKLLLGAGAQANAVDEYKQAAIHIAAETNKIEVVKVLVAFGAGLEIADINGMTPLFRAALAGQVEVVKVLLAAGAKANPSDIYGNPLITVIEKKNIPEIAKILRDSVASPKPTIPLQLTGSISGNSSANSSRNIIAPGIEFPKKVADYFVQTAGNWKKGNPYNGDVSVSKISPNTYKIEYSFQQPIDYSESGQTVIILNQCLANHIAEITHSKGWDVGHERDMMDRNFGSPFSGLSYLILTGAKDGESREHATGRKTMSWMYGEVLENKSLQYANSYPSVIGDCKKLLKPEFTTYLAPNAFVTVNGKKLPTRLWALANQDQMGASNGLDIIKNASISYESKNSRLLKIEIGFDDPVNNMYMLSMSVFAGCIGSYMAPKKSFEAFAIGWPEKLQSEPSHSDSSSKMVFYTIGLNSGDDIDALSGQSNIKWMASNGKVDIAKQKFVSDNMANTCPKMVKSDYLDTTKAQRKDDHAEDVKTQRSKASNPITSSATENYPKNSSSAQISSSTVSGEQGRSIDKNDKRNCLDLKTSAEIIACSEK